MKQEGLFCTANIFFGASELDSIHVYASDLDWEN